MRGGSRPRPPATGGPRSCSRWSIWGSTLPHEPVDAGSGNDLPQPRPAPPLEPERGPLGLPADEWGADRRDHLPQRAGDADAPPAAEAGALCALISHLSLNHWSLIKQRGGREGLRKILAIYDFADSADTRKMIEGLFKRPLPPRGGAKWGWFCRGLEVTVHLDEDRFAGQGVYLFAAVLERFLGLYCSLQFVLETDRHHQSKGKSAAAMAATGGGNGPAVSQQVQDPAHQFDFFQAVRVLHWMARRESREACGVSSESLRCPTNHAPRPTNIGL